MSENLEQIQNNMKVAEEQLLAEDAIENRPSYPDIYANAFEGMVLDQLRRERMEKIGQARLGRAMAFHYCNCPMCENERKVALDNRHILQPAFDAAHEARTLGRVYWVQTTNGPFPALAVLTGLEIAELSSEDWDLVQSYGCWYPAINADEMINLRHPEVIRHMSPAMWDEYWKYLELRPVPLSKVVEGSKAVYLDFETELFDKALKATIENKVEANNQVLTEIAKSNPFEFEKGRFAPFYEGSDRNTDLQEYGEAPGTGEPTEEDAGPEKRSISEIAKTINHAMAYGHGFALLPNSADDRSVPTPPEPAEEDAGPAIMSFAERARLANGR